MKNNALRAVMAVALAGFSGLASAAMSSPDAHDAVESMLAEGRPAVEIIEALVSDGRNLSEATSTAMGAVSGDQQLDLARAGICASIDLREAQEVGSSALNMLQSELARNVVQGTVEGYSTGACAAFARKSLPPPMIQDRGDTVEGRGTATLLSPVSLAN